MNYLRGLYYVIAVEVVDFKRLIGIVFFAGVKPEDRKRKW